MIQCCRKEQPGYGATVYTALTAHACGQRADGQGEADAHRQLFYSAEASGGPQRAEREGVWIRSGRKYGEAIHVLFLNGFRRPPNLR